MSASATAFGPGLHAGVPMADYLALEALGSGSLNDLARSPLQYRWMLANPGHPDTEATIKGTALHAAVLEPGHFAARYAAEPDGALLAPDAAKPRATKAYKEAVAALMAEGRIVLKSDVLLSVEAMAEAIREHPHAARLLDRCPEREVTTLWEEAGRLCRGRPDALGPGVVCNLKTTRSLKDFSPWVISRLAYYRQAAWESRGLKANGRAVEHFFFIAVENAPPYDVGVFVLDPEALAFGERECCGLLATLAECERTDEWPGMFPEVQHAMLSDVITASEMEDNTDGSS